MAFKITNENLEEVIAGGKPVVVDFWAEWCGPCRTIAPFVDELATEYEGRVVVGKCDVDENDAVAIKYGIRNIPTLIFLKGGEIVDRQVGATTKAALQEKINNLL